MTHKTNRQIFGMAREQRDAGETNLYGNLAFGNQEFNASANTARPLILDSLP